MSRYVIDRNGVVIGSGNHFSFKDPEGELQSFPAILWLRKYAFAQITTANYRILTPAEQLVYTRRASTDAEYAAMKKAMMVESAPEEIIVPSRLVVGLLDEFAPGWAYPVHQYGDKFGTFFFRKRQHAVKLKKWIAHNLKGIQIENERLARLSLI